MLTNELKIVFRNLYQHKRTSLINILGLAVGLACFLLIALWVQDELSFDRYHQHAGDIYRIVYKDAEQTSAVTHYPLAHALKESIPGIEQSARMEGSPRMICRYRDKVFYEDRILLGDATLFDIFTFPFIRGNPQTALNRPGDLVITESMARKYFGQDDPMGKTIMINGQFPCTVTGLVQDVPKNSHFRFDFLIPMDMLKIIGVDMESWNSTGIYTYVRLSEQADPEQVQSKIAGFLENFLPGTQMQLVMQPLTKIYLSSGFQFDVKGLGDIRYVYLFSILGGLILLIACLNYINLATARSLRRRGEIGVRKVVGAVKSQLVGQLFIESLVYVVLAMGLALVLAELSLPAFQQMTGKALTIPYSDIRTLLFLLGLVVLTSLASGIYPALILSDFQPIETIKTSTFFRDKQFSLKNSRRIFVVIQFMCSILLIIATIVITQQRRFIREQKLGFDKEHVIYFPLGNTGSKYDILKSELLKNPSITQVALSQYLPTAGSPRSGDIRWESQENRQISAIYKYIDPNYLNLLETEFAEGRNFSGGSPVDKSEGFILNETAVSQMGLKSPLGKRISLNGQQGHIVGVIKDAYFRSFHHVIEPIIFRQIPDENSLAALVQGIVYIRFSPGDLQATISSMQVTIQRVVGDLPSEYHFLDQEYEALYSAEARMGTLFNFATIIAIVLASIGLFGLSAFLIEQRTKEIGIRKVLGATESGLVLLLSREFIVGIIVANILAWPVAWYAMHKWLQNFAYRIDLTIWPFIIAGATALVIALVTISWQAIRTARANPMESLRYE